MAISQITQFPINTIFKFATSGEFGLCPQLCAYIHDDINETDPNSPVSEHAIRTTLNEISTDVYYENVGNGYGVWSHTVEPTAFYKQLETDGLNISGTIINNTVILSGNAVSPNNNSDPNVSGNILSVQGGLYQYSDTIQTSGIPTTGYTIAHASQDDVIGKIFIKCTEPFVPQGDLLSIGLTGDHQRYVNNFIAPSATGLRGLDYVYYGNGLSGEYDWLSTDKDIILFKTGSNSTAGEIGISIFYDNVVWAPSYGYVMGTLDSPIQRFNLDFDYLQASSRGSKVGGGNKQYTAVSNNSYIYSAGGTDSAITTVFNDINRFETKNDTVNALDRGNLSVARRGLTSIKSTIKAYFIGGTDAATPSLYDTYDYIQFSNDTANAYSGLTLLSNRSSAWAVANSISLWVAGGFYNQTANATNTLECCDFSSDTSSNAAGGAVLNSAKAGTSSALNISNTHGLFPCGVGNTTATTTNEADLFAFSTETFSDTISDFLLITVSDAATVQSSTNGYFIGGQNIDPSYIVYNTVQKYNFTTQVVSITDSNSFLETTLQAGASV